MTQAVLQAALKHVPVSAAARLEVRQAALATIKAIYAAEPDSVVAAVQERSGPGTGQTDLMAVRNALSIRLRNGHGRWHIVVTSLNLYLLRSALLS